MEDEGERPSLKAIAERSWRPPFVLKMCPICRARCIRVASTRQIILTAGRVPGRYGGALQCTCCGRKMRDPMMNEGARRRKRVWKGTFWADPLLPADRIAIQMMERFPHIEPLVELAREVLEGWGLRAQTYWNRMEAGRVKMPLWDRMARALESHEERARLLRLVLRVQEMERAWALAAMQNPNLPIAPIDWRRAAWWLAERRAGAAEVRRKLQRAIEAYGIVLGRRRQRMATATLIGALAMRERGFENEAALWEWVVEVVSRGPLPDEESHPVDQAFEVWRRAGWDVERG